MKKSYKILVLIVPFLFLNCEKVVDIALDNSAPQLVIDASIKWKKGSLGNQQSITLTNSNDFYSKEVAIATGAIVEVTNTSVTPNKTYVFLEKEKTGVYNCANFEPVLNDIYQLAVRYNNQKYTSTSPLVPTPDIEKNEQSLKQGFGDDVYEIKIYFQDAANQDDFYLTAVKNNEIAFPEYGVLSDQFTQGNLMSSTYIDELKPGATLEYSLQGITEAYSDYMFKLLNIAGTDGGNPFATTPATLRGNISNTTQADNFPLGYFHLSEITTGSITVK